MAIPRVASVMLLLLVTSEGTEEPRRLGRSKRVVGGEKIASFGLSPQASDPAKVRAGAVASSAQPLPAKVDLRAYMTEVEDQKRSNSCAANAVAGAYEYLAKRAALEQNDEVGDISRLFIYYVGRKRDQVRWGEDTSKAPKDEGMTLGGAIEAVQMKGACLANTWPFDLEKVNKKPTIDGFDEAMNYKVGSAKKVPMDLDSMRSSLAQGYPIIFGLKLTAGFFSPPPSGLIKTPDPNDPKSASHGLHAMLLVGYNDRAKVFIVRNSWGADWGVGGYCYLPYDYGANPDFNFLGMYSIHGLTDSDLTPDDDDGEDPSLDGDHPEPELEEVEDEEEADEDDDFDADDMFSSEAEARRAFSKFDKDNTGYLNQEELGAALKMCGHFLSKTELADVLKKYDTNPDLLGKGKIGFKEFLKMQDEFEEDSSMQFYLLLGVAAVVLPALLFMSTKKSSKAAKADVKKSGGKKKAKKI